MGTDEALGIDRVWQPDLAEEKLFPLMLATISNPALLIPSRLSNFYRPYLTNEYRVLGFTHRNRVSPIITVVVTK
jgi:hypothetical protein